MFRNLINKIAASSDLYKALDNDAEELAYTALRVVGAAEAIMPSIPPAYKDRQDFLIHRLEDLQTALNQYECSHEQRNEK